MSYNIKKYKLDMTIIEKKEKRKEKKQLSH